VIAEEVTMRAAEVMARRRPMANRHTEYKGKRSDRCVFVWTAHAYGQTVSYRTEDGSLNLIAVPVYTPSNKGITLRSLDCMDKLVYAQALVPR
jgi:hypothetical protein